MAIIYYYKAYAEFKSGDFDTSLQDTNKAIEKDSKKYKYYLLRAKIYNEKNIFDKTLKLNASFNNFIERGDFLAKHEKYKDSIKDYTAAIVLNNQNAEIYKQRGYIYQKLKKDKEAEADFEQALKLNPSADVPLEKKIIAQQEEQQTKDQQPSQQEYSQVKQETPLNSENTKGKDNCTI
jgi:tetratricopeptide (TPR) repeat protein